MLHDESLLLHGGASGIRDEGLLDSALNRAVNLALYSEPDFADLTAAYTIGLAKFMRLWMTTSGAHFWQWVFF